MTEPAKTESDPSEPVESESATDAGPPTPTASPHGDIRLPEGVSFPNDAPEPIDPRMRITLPNFEGPLDLLLFLIKKHELDILDLPIAFVTERYVEYMNLLETLNLDVAAEYLVMAATLAHIKSKSLLPRAPDDDDDVDEDEMDPREELIRRLLAYQKYKRAAEQLGARGVVGRDVFPRGIPAPTAEGPAPLAEVSVFKLIDIFQKILERHEGNLAFEIDAEQVTIQERMGQITEMIQQRSRVPFEDLFEGYASTYDLVVSFLALLEMAKMRLLRVYQADPDGPLYLEARILDVNAETDEEAVAAAMTDEGHAEAVAAAMEALPDDPELATAVAAAMTDEGLAEAVAAAMEDPELATAEPIDSDPLNPDSAGDAEQHAPPPSAVGDLENTEEGDKEPSPS